MFCPRVNKPLPECLASDLGAAEAEKQVVFMIASREVVSGKKRKEDNIDTFS